jgi:acetyltransferase EpsM
MTSLLSEGRVPMPRSEIVVIGAGGLGREVRDAIDAAQARGGPEFVGFLDDYAEGPEVIGTVSAMGSIASVCYVVAIGDSAVRAGVVGGAPPNVEFASVVHPAAVVSPRATVGPGVFVAPLAYIGPGAIVGAHTIVNVHSQVGHDAVTGEFVTLSPLVALNGHSIVGQGSFLGSVSAVDIGVSVGRWSKVAAGSRVTRSAGDGFLLVGNPAKGRQMFQLPRQSQSIGLTDGDEPQEHA